MDLRGLTWIDTDEAGEGQWAVGNGQNLAGDKGIVEWM